MSKDQTLKKTRTLLFPDLHPPPGVPTNSDQLSPARRLLEAPSFPRPRTGKKRKIKSYPSSYQEPVAKHGPFFKVLRRKYCALVAQYLNYCVSIRSLPMTPLH